MSLVGIGIFCICNGGIGKRNDFRPESKIKCAKGQFLYLESLEWGKELKYS